LTLPSGDVVTNSDEATLVRPPPEGGA
jgi:hypothetical protein